MIPREIAEEASPAILEKCGVAKKASSFKQPEIWKGEILSHVWVKGCRETRCLFRTKVR